MWDTQMWDIQSVCDKLAVFNPLRVEGHCSLVFPLPFVAKAVPLPCVFQPVCGLPTASFSPRTGAPNSPFSSVMAMISSNVKFFMVAAISWGQRRAKGSV